jgi:hypothetical protein
MSKTHLDDTQIYEIQVLGRISAGHADWFNGMAINVTEDAEEHPISTLYGAVVDQSVRYENTHGLIVALPEANLPV